ncbi:hypothetical protein ACFYTQ_36765 [Nocardia sp. NPDC004068]|uniref:hypothetical protein n=1 Tax=Nocardia sp. NPDC004068 TaxID=3364303 RepID=UPI00368F0F19
MTNPRQYEQTYEGGLDKARKDLERFLREDGANVFNPDQPIWNDKAKITGTDVNALLDSAAPGLQWFELALVRYHRVYEIVKLPGFDRIDVPALDLGGEKVGAETIDAAGDPMKEIRRLEFKYYDQQRSMNLASLRELSSRITTAAVGNDARSGAAQVTADLSSVATAVPEYWQGQSGAAASDHLVGFHAHAEQQAQYLQAVSAALTGLPDVLLQIVRDKASFVAGFDSPQCPVAGHAMRLSGFEDPVSQIITVAANQHDANYNTPEAVKQQFHLVELKAARDFGKIRDISQQWLSDHFRFAVQEAFTAFVHQCALADYYIRQAYKPVIELLDSHDQAPFPKPRDEPAPNPPGRPAPTAVPGEVRTQAANVDSGEVSPVTRSIPERASVPVTPAATVNSPLQGLAGLAGQAGQAVQQGLSQLQGSLQQGLSQMATTAAGVATPNLDTGAVRDVPGVSPNEIAGSRTLASLELPGGKLTLAQASNGTFTAAVTTPDGKLRQYSVGVKDGKPFFTENTTTSTQSVASGSSGGADEPPVGRSGSNAVEAGGALGANSTAGAAQPGLPLARPAAETVGSVATPPTLPTPDPAMASGIPQTGMPMSGSPAAGAGGGKGSPDAERRSSGIVTPQPLWAALPGRDGMIDDPGAPMLASVENLHGLPESSPPPPAANSETVNREQAQSVSESTPLFTAPVVQADGVKIEIDMGDKR